jgi:hypothetical protein
MNLHVARTRAVRFCLATGLALVGLLSVASAAAESFLSTLTISVSATCRATTLTRRGRPRISTGLLRKE